MTVALIGVAVDDTNSDPYPQIYDDHSFEYVPIPEAHETTTDLTYNSIARHHTGGHLQPADTDDETLADVLTEISPEEDEGDTLTGNDIETYPLHYDPNFNELMYGEVKTANRNKINRLDPNSNDVIAFYTGLTTPEDDTPHRFIIGFFTVQEVIDFQSMMGDSLPFASDEEERVVVEELPSETRERVVTELERHTENAHVKRYEATGTIDKDLMIVNGTEPGGLLKQAYPISQPVAGGHGFTEEVEREFNVRSTKEDRETGWLGGFKKAHLLGLSGPDFVVRMTE